MSKNSSKTKQAPKTMEELVARVAELEAIVAKKDREIQDLEDDVEDKDSEIADLESQVNELERNSFDVIGDQEMAAMRAIEDALPDPSRETYEQFEFRRNLRVIFDALEEANARS